jgi:hypothetical protein
MELALMVAASVSCMSHRTRPRTREFWSMAIRTQVNFQTGTLAVRRGMLDIRAVESATEGANILKKPGSPPSASQVSLLHCRTELSTQWKQARDLKTLEEPLP